MCPNNYTFFGLQLQKHAVKHAYTWANSLCIVGAICTALYFHFFEKPWLSYTDQPFKILTPVVHPGQVIQMVVNRCTSSDDKEVYTVARKLNSLDDLEIRPFSLGATSGDMDPTPRCNSVISSVNVVPPLAIDEQGKPTLKTGKYFLTGYAPIRGVFGRVRNVEYRSEPFTIVVP